MMMSCSAVSHGLRSRIRSSLLLASVFAPARLLPFLLLPVLLLPHPLRHLTPHRLPYRLWLTVSR
ncbi:hypothetical protein ACKUCW_002206 [Escherichia coli]